MNPNQKKWNEQQQVLQHSLKRIENHPTAIRLFLNHHAMVHSAKMSQAELWSFEDEVLDDLTESEIRRIPQDGEHSIAWVLLHLARIEDVTMNILVAGRPQIFQDENWLTKMEFISNETGNALDQTGISILSKGINIDALRTYRISVGRRTREIVKQLQPGEFRQRVNPARLERLTNDGAIVESTRWLIDYWSKKTIAELLLMPPTRHNFVHLNEAVQIKQKIRHEVSQ